MEGQEATLQRYHAAHRPRALMRRQVTHIRSIPARAPPPVSQSLETGGGHPSQLTSRRFQSTTSDMLGRICIQPPVCGVQPGRMLSLRTKLGLQHVKSVLAQQQELDQQQMALSPPETQTGGLLRQAKLQPLGVVDESELRPQECLGVVPVATAKARSERRPKSCIAPVSFSEQGDHTHQHHHAHYGTPIDAHRGPAKLRKRSFSAVLPRNVSDDTLRQLLSITRHTGLPTHRETNAETTPTTITGANGQSLLAVTGQTDFMKIEMKGLRRKNSPRYPPKKAKSQETEVEGSKPEGRGGLPLISDALKVAEDAGTKLTVTVTSKKHSSTDCVTSESSVVLSPPPPLQANTSSTNASTTPPHLSTGPVVMGGAKGVGSHRLGSSRPRRLSGGTAGRLSQGWSPAPQPIGALKGSPVITHASPLTTATTPGLKGGMARTKKRIAGLGEGEEPGQDGRRSQMVASPTPSMMINVNVSEFLTPAECEQDDETVT